MSRLAYATLLTTCLTAGTALAAPLNLNPYPDYAAARRSASPPSGLGAVVAAPPAPAPERQVVAQGPSFGGGVIEMLFRPGGQHRTYQAQPEPMAPAYQQPRSRLFTPDGDYVQPAAIEPSRRDVDPRYQRQEVNYDGRERPGTVIINTKERLLYLVRENGRATRYGIGVGRPGFTWAGTHSISSKREWPDWRPPPEMIRRQPEPAALHARRSGQPARRPRHVSRLDALPHPRLERALDHRPSGVVRLHPDAQRGRHPPLQPGQGRDAGGGDLTPPREPCLAEPRHHPRCPPPHATPTSTSRSMHGARTPYRRAAVSRNRIHGRRRRTARPAGWLVSDARPDMIKAVLAIEPNGPPVHTVEFIGAPNWFKEGAVTLP